MTRTRKTEISNENLQRVDEILEDMKRFRKSNPRKENQVYKLVEGLELVQSEKEKKQNFINELLFVGREYSEYQSVSLLMLVLLGSVALTIVISEGILYSFNVQESFGIDNAWTFGFVFLGISLVLSYFLKPYVHTEMLARTSRRWTPYKLYKAFTVFNIIITVLSFGILYVGLSEENNEIKALTEQLSNSSGFGMSVEEETIALTANQQDHQKDETEDYFAQVHAAISPFVLMQLSLTMLLAAIFLEVKFMLLLIPYLNERKIRRLKNLQKQNQTDFSALKVFFLLLLEQMDQIDSLNADKQILENF